MGGAFGKEVQELFHISMGQQLHRDPSHKRPAHYARDIQRFIQDFKGDGIFHYCPPRHHSAFPEFVDKGNKIKSPVKLGKHIGRLAKKMDFWRRRAQRARENH